MKIFYHSADFDGHSSAAIAATFCLEKNINFNLIGINYGYNFNDIVLEKIKGDNEILIVDFSFKSDEINYLIRRNYIITWIDHHITAIDDLKNIKNRNFLNLSKSENKSAACKLVWKHFFRERKIPRSLELLSLYDTGNFSDKDVMEFQYGLRQYETSVEMNLPFWQELLFSGDEYKTEEIINDGRIILRYLKKELEEYVKTYAYEIKFHGLNVLICNRGKTGSILFESIYDPNKHDAVITYCYKDNKWVFGMYSDKENVDCSKIAKLYGGGGHKSACGWILSELSDEFLK